MLRSLRAILPSYFRVALRKFRSNLAFSTINVLGLSVALSVCLLVLAFTNNQASYDSFHETSDRIYRATTTLPAQGQGSTERYASSPYHLGPILEDRLPGVAETVRLQPFSGAASLNEVRLSVRGLRADSTFFDLFDFELTSGAAGTVLDNPNSIVLTEETASRFFGDVNPIGKLLRFGDGDRYQVTGVVSRNDVRSHLEFDVLTPIRSEPALSKVRDWENPTWYTYILLDRSDAGTVRSQLGPLVASVNPSKKASQYEISLQSLEEINLGPLLEREIGRITPVQFVYFLAALALVIILAAGINYVNLTTARSLQRTQEIGMRKVIGAGRFELVAQFLSESVVVAFISLGLGLLLFLGWLLPYWNSMRLATADFGLIQFDPVRDADLLLAFVAFALLVGLIAGLYPAAKLSSLSPIRALNQKVSKSNLSGWSPSKGLVVVQIALSVILLGSTLLLYRQANHLLNTDYGFRQSNVINVELGDVSYDTFRDAVSTQAGVLGVSAISQLPAVDFPDRTWVRRAQQPDSVRTALYSADENVIENLDIQLVAGRNFSSAYASDAGRAVVINELATDRLGFDSPRDALGAPIQPAASDRELQVVGIAENFHFDFLWEPNSPLVLWNNPEAATVANIKLAGSDHESALANIRDTWQQLEPVSPLEYEYYRNQIGNVYADFRELADVVFFLSAMAILLACLGLLAMAYYDTQNRVKEIGVRKVLGATVRDLVWLLSSGFTKMIGIAILVAVPVTIYLNQLWLQIFANRIELTGAVIGGAVGAVVLLAYVSIGWQTVSAAVSDPVKSIRSE